MIQVITDAKSFRYSTLNNITKEDPYDHGKKESDERFHYR